MLAAIYNNGKKSNLFRVRVDVTLSEDRRIVHNVEYRHPLTDLDESVEFTLMKLRSSIFGQYNTKRPIEFDALLVRSFKDI